MDGDLFVLYASYGPDALRREFGDAGAALLWADWARRRGVLAPVAREVVGALLPHVAAWMIGRPLG